MENAFVGDPIHSTFAHQARAGQGIVRSWSRTAAAQPLPPVGARFSLSPSPYFARLAAIYRGSYVDYRGVGLVVRLLELEGDTLIWEDCAFLHHIDGFLGSYAMVGRMLAPVSRPGS